MRFNKSNIIISVIFSLFILLLFLPKLVDLIPSGEVKFAISIILALLVFIFILFETYGDITKKQFTTTPYIVLSDIISIIAFAVLGYLSFTKFDLKNIEVLLYRINARNTAALFLFGGMLIRNFFKSQRFEKKISC